VTLVTVPEATSLQVWFCVSACHRTDFSCKNSSARLQKRQGLSRIDTRLTGEPVTMHRISVISYLGGKRDKSLETSKKNQTDGEFRMSYQEASQPDSKVQQRRSKFTPERIQQIEGLVGRGETCQQIAAVIGVTVGTLKVTCSRLGISLRRPKVKLLPSKTATSVARTVGAAGEIAILAVNMKYKGREHSTVLPLSLEMISQLALEASFRDQEIGELAKDILVSVFKKGLIPDLLGK
jgi:hypothetical protein